MGFFLQQTECINHADVVTLQLLIECMNRPVNKYFKLMAWLMAAFLAFTALVVLLFYLLKLCSITLFIIPGFDSFYHFIIIIIPYLIFFAGYYYMQKKIAASKSKTSSAIAWVLIITGSLLCLVTMVISTLTLFNIQKSFLLTYEDNSQYTLIIQVVFLFLTALIIATGDEKEKDWMDKNKEAFTDKL